MVGLILRGGVTCQIFVSQKSTIVSDQISLILVEEDSHHHLDSLLRSNESCDAEFIFDLCLGMTEKGSLLFGFVAGVARQ